MRGRSHGVLPCVAFVRVVCVGDGVNLDKPKPKAGTACLRRCPHQLRFSPLVEPDASVEILCGGYADAHFDSQSNVLHAAGMLAALYLALNVVVAAPFGLRGALGGAHRPDGGDIYNCRGDVFC